MDPVGLMAAVWAFWPIADDFEAQIGSTLETDPVDANALMYEMIALWNTEADPDEFYHGVYRGARQGTQLAPVRVDRGWIRRHHVLVLQPGLPFRL